LISNHCDDKEIEMKHTVTLHAYAHKEFDFIDGHDRLVFNFYTGNMDKYEINSAKMGEFPVEIECNPPTEKELQLAIVANLRKAAVGVRAEAQAKIAEIEERIQSLLALEDRSGE